MTGNGDPYKNKLRESSKAQALRGAKGSGTCCGRRKSTEEGQEAKERPYCRVFKKPGEKINKRISNTDWVHSHFHLDNIFINLTLALLQLCHKSRFLGNDVMMLEDKQNGKAGRSFPFTTSTEGLFQLSSVIFVAPAPAGAHHDPAFTRRF